MDQYLTRFAYTPMGTFGRWGPFQTVEEVWRDNQSRISCIPVGVYPCVRGIFHRGGYPTFEIMDVPNRSLIKVHRANTVEDLLGCIGIGLSLGVLNVRDEDSQQMVHKLAALSSRAGFDAWMESLLGINNFRLHVVDYKTPRMELE